MIHGPVQYWLSCQLPFRHNARARDLLQWDVRSDYAMGDMARERVGSGTGILLDTGPSGHFLVLKYDGHEIERVRFSTREAAMKS